ncbi:MAG: hypothetical protein M0002_17480 [Rhodospirillales bacterium]|nr:hypothetical protein [Rhodospirillales bacterium]
MVRLLFVLCALHGTTCHRVDPLYQAMSALTCNMRQITFYEQWAVENPELVAGQRLKRTLCVPAQAIQVKI